MIEPTSGAGARRIGVDEHRFVGEAAADDERNELFRASVRLAEDVHRVRHDHGQLVRVAEGNAQLFRAGLRGGVGVPRAIPVPDHGTLDPVTRRPKDFVRREIENPLKRIELPRVASRLQVPTVLSITNASGSSIDRSTCVLAAR